MTLLIVAAVIVAYLAVGLVYARLSAVRTWQASMRNNRHCSAEQRREYVEVAVWTASVARAVAWPLAAPIEILRVVIGFLLRHATGFVTRPVTAREDRIKQLRADAKHWEAKGKPSSGRSAEEQEMARVVAADLYDRIRALESR